MDDEKFENIMDKWASHEIRSAPKLRPAEKIYQMLKSKQKKALFFKIPGSIRWAAAGIAAAAIIALTILYQQTGNGQLPVMLREGRVSEKGVTMHEPETVPGRGGKGGKAESKKGHPSVKQLQFHYQKQGSGFIEGIDIQNPVDESIILSSEDNYRLLIELTQDYYVYIYQSDAKNELMKLFPNEMYSPVQNPLKGGLIHYLPTERNWFYLAENAGEETIYIAAFLQPKHDWDELYSGYTGTDNAQEKQEILSRLLDEFASIEKMQSEGAFIYIFMFNN